MDDNPLFSTVIVLFSMFYVYFLPRFSTKLLAKSWYTLACFDPYISHYLIELNLQISHSNIRGHYEIKREGTWRG